MAHTKVAFIGFHVSAMRAPELDKAIGKVIAVVNTKGAANGPEPLREYGFNRAGFQVLRRHFAALLAGKGKTNPLFDDTGAPVVTPRVLSKEERKAATP